MNPWANQTLSLWRGDPRAMRMLDWAEGKIDADKWAAFVPPQRNPSSSGGVGILSLEGVIMRRPGVIESMMGATSLDAFMASFRGAVENPDLDTIVMLINSPGGEVYGVPEAAAEIRAARSKKRIVAVAEDMAASAAYWLASQADEIVVTPSGGVGAIECYHVHADMTAALEQAGVKLEVFAGGPNRRALAEGVPLTDEDRAHLQGQADAYYDLYVADVAKGRGVSVKDVTSGYGEGRYMLAKAAKAAGMADRIDTLRGTVGHLLSGRRVASHAQMSAQISDGGADTMLPLVPESAYPDGSVALEPLTPLAGPIARHKTATSDKPWDGPANEARLPSEAGPLKASHAWMDSAGDPNVKASYKFIHHEVGADGNVGAANLIACSSGCGVLNGARGGTLIPPADKAGVHAHLAGHLTDGGQMAPPLKSEADIERSALEIEVRQRRAVS